MTTEPSDDEVRTRPFADLLLDLNRGHTHAELSRAMQDVVAAVLDTGKPGLLTLAIKVESARSHDQVLITDKVTVKLPEARAASIFFVTSELNLTRDDPQQPALPLREVPQPANTDLREAR